MIHGQSKISGLIGTHIAKSLSFAMHNYALNSLKIDACYLPFCAQPHDLPNITPVFRTPSFVGANVTIPHKQAIIPLLDTLDAHAQRIKAVNTIISLPDGTLKGANSDAPGFLRALQEDNISTHRTVLILGAGGAARAIVDALSTDAHEIIISNRTPDRAHTLIKDAQEMAPQQRYRFCADPTDLPLPSDTLIIQCTPLGKHGEMPPHPQLHPQMSIVDLLYQHTPLLAKAQHIGARIQNGTPMLYHQAALSFSWWFHTPPPITLMKQALNQRMAS